VISSNDESADVGVCGAGASPPIAGAAVSANTLKPVGGSGSPASGITTALHRPGESRSNSARYNPNAPSIIHVNVAVSVWTTSGRSVWLTEINTSSVGEPSLRPPPSRTPKSTRERPTPISALATIANESAGNVASSPVAESSSDPHATTTSVSAVTSATVRKSLLVIMAVFASSGIANLDRSHRTLGGRPICDLDRAATNEVIPHMAQRRNAVE